jgi:hypothetical protein
MRVDRDGGGRRQRHHRTVGRRDFQGFEREPAAGARAVVDDDGRRIALHLVDEEARDHVGRTARRIADDHAGELADDGSDHLGGRG